MRTDIHIDTKQTRLPLRCHLGYSKCTARFGDWISYAYPETPGIFNGRVIGRIANDPEGKCNGHIVIAQVSTDLTFTYARWIDPNWVLSCHAHEHVEKAMERMLKPWTRGKASELRQWTEGLIEFEKAQLT